MSCENCGCEVRLDNLEDQVVYLLSFLEGQRNRIRNLEKQLEAIAELTNDLDWRTSGSMLIGPP